MTAGILGITKARSFIPTVQCGGKTYKWWVEEKEKSLSSFYVNHHCLSLSRCEMEADWTCLCSCKSEWGQFTANEGVRGDEERWSLWEKVKWGDKRREMFTPQQRDGLWHPNHPMSSSFSLSFSLLGSCCGMWTHPLDITSMPVSREGANICLVFNLLFSKEDSV